MQTASPTAPTPPTAAAVNRAAYDDLPVKMMVYPAVLFLVLGMFFGTFISFNGFIFPDYFAGEYMHFGRMRPVHVLHVTWLWLLSANIGLLYFMTQRLCGVPLWSHRLGIIAPILWWAASIPGTYSLPLGTNFGWEYAEMPQTLMGWWPVKPMYTISFAIAAFNMFMTIATRRYEKLYVTLWYTMGTLIWTTFTVLAGYYGLLAVPGGISRVNVSWFYVHNLVGLIFTPMGLATAYYFLPKLANTPIYSHRLSMIGFWTIAFVYAWVGAHHMIHGPISQWLQTVAIIFSIWLFIPVFTVVTNLFATMKGQWSQYTQSAPIRFLLMGNFFYLITCIQGPLMAVRNINEITSKTDWVIGHSHISLYGTFTFFAIAGIYGALPYLTKKPIWSSKLADWHFTLSFLGGMLMFLTLFLGGFFQGLQWANWANGSSYPEFHNNLAKLPFLTTISDMHIWWLLRAISGVIILTGNILFAVNVYNTIVLAPTSNKPQAQMRRGQA